METSGARRKLACIVSDASFNSFAAPDGSPESTQQEIAELIERLRVAAEHLPTERTAQHDLKLLSRAIRELRRAFSVFAPYRAQRKVTIFGSARTPRDAAPYQQAVELGRAMVQHGWFVVTGASTGIMEAGHRGAGRDHSMGLNIMLPFEQDANEIIRGDHKLVTMKYFFTRKLMFVKECDAVVCLPGGFGTLDEAFEVLTLLQTGKRELIPVVLLDAPGGKYWRDWLDFVRANLLANGMISADDLSLLLITESVDETVQEITRFYRVFHSMQFIPDRLMLRLKSRPNDRQLAAMSRRFADVLSDGTFSLLETPAGEPDEPELASLVRLVFHFNRRNHGRLRQLIDWVNREVGA
jgi:uncharacterized protein (TIGR00730 family)